MKFRIEYIARKERPVYLFARQLETGEFFVSQTSRLGDVPIKPQVSRPRALTPDGKPDLSVFAFVLVTANDLPKLEVGQVVELSSSRE
jgi:hypothetical protein